MSSYKRSDIESEARLNKIFIIQLIDERKYTTTTAKIIENKKKIKS